MPSPKWLDLHRFSHSFKLESEADLIPVNPRRIDYYRPVTPPTQHPNLYCGTLIRFGGRELIVQETVTEIRRMIKA